MKHIEKEPAFREFIGAASKGDLFTRSASNQFVLMLQNLTYEDCQTLSKKIARRFSQNRYSCTLNPEINQITPIE